MNRTSRLLSGFLRYGVLVCAAILLLGLLMHSTTVLTIGLGCLFALPIGRVAFLTGIFALEKDWIYMAMSLFILAVLATSLIVGRSI